MQLKVEPMRGFLLSTLRASGSQHCAAPDWCLNEQKGLPLLYIGLDRLMVAVESAVIFDLHHPSVVPVDSYRR
jgi:hypothetical protein